MPQIRVMAYKMLPLELVSVQSCSEFTFTQLAVAIRVDRFETCVDLLQAVVRV